MKLYKTLIVFLLIASFISCEKDSELGFFDQQYPREAPWPSANDFENAVIGSYWLLSGNNASRNPFMAQRLVLDAASDGLYFDQNFGGDAASGESYDRNNVDNNRWSDAIFKCNYMSIGTHTDAISFMESYENNNPYPFDINKDQVPRMEGEIRFCRAYSWWQLSTTFMNMYEPGGGNSDQRIPLLSAIPGGFEEAVNGSLATTQEIYDIMVSDLERAIEILPEKYVMGEHHPSYQFGRANKYAAMSLLTRVYLQMNEFDKVKQLCDNILNYAESTGYYSLDQEPIEAFNKAYGFEGEGTEVIWFYLQYEGDGVGSWKNQFIAEKMSKCRRYGDNHSGRSLSCSDSFLETVGWQDPATKEPTAEASADKRYNQLYHRYLPSVDKPADYPDPNDGVYETQFTTNRAHVWGNKYYRDENNRRGTNIPIFRLPEIYLTRAILRLKAGDSTGAMADVNKIRVANGVDPLTSITEDDIHNERWKELNFEGDRVTYLRSLHIDVPNGDRGDGALAWDSQQWNWQILLRELELNKAYEGWSE